MHYKPQFDGVRGLAVTVVIISHTWLDVAGHRGVQLFFVLSGLLITLLLLDDVALIERGNLSRADALRGFYLRRILRIGPPYYTLLALLALVPGFGIRDGLLYHLTLSSNIHFALAGQWQPAVVAPMWSLGVENQFYAIWPLVVLWMPRHRLGVLVGAMVTAAVVFRTLLGVGDEKTVITATVIPIASFDALGLGALVALHLHDGRVLTNLKRLGIVMGAVALASDIGMLEFEGFPSAWYSCVELAWAVAFAGLLACLYEDNVWHARILSIGPLVFIGRISYGMYLIHAALLLRLLHVSDRLGFSLPPGPLRFGAVFVAAVLAALVLRWLIESRVERWRQSLRRRPASSPVDVV